LVPASVSAPPRGPRGWCARGAGRGSGARAASRAKEERTERPDSSGTSGALPRCSARWDGPTLAAPRLADASRRATDDEGPGDRRGPRGCSVCADSELLGLGGLEVGLVPRGGGVLGADLVLALGQAG